MPRKLEPRIVAGLRPVPGKIVNVRDAHRKAAGLELRIFPSGERRWAVRYRIGSRQRRLTLGDAAILSLADAREAARNALKQVSNGHDPAEEKRAKRDADTVGDFATIYLDEYAKPTKKSWKNDKAILDHNVLPKWKHRPMREITRRDGRELLKVIVDRGAPIHANRVRALLSKFFAFAASQEVVDANPMRDVPRPSKENVRERVLSADEIRTFWTVTEGLPTIKQAIWRIRLLTAKRPGEVPNMRWPDVDLEAGWWTIPGEFTKNGVTDRVALSPSVLKMLQDIREEQQKTSEDQRPRGWETFVFAGIRGKKGHAVKFLLENFQARDLRKTAATLMSEGGVSDETIDRILNHKKKGIIASYNLNKYDSEKRMALDGWARQLEGIINPKEANVVTFARA